jgi:hypothetical protein
MCCESSGIQATSKDEAYKNHGRLNAAQLQPSQKYIQNRRENGDCRKRSEARAQTGLYPAFPAFPSFPSGTVGTRKRTLSFFLLVCALFVFTAPFGGAEEAKIYEYDINGDGVKERIPLRQRYTLRPRSEFKRHGLAQHVEVGVYVVETKAALELAQTLDAVPSPGADPSAKELIFALRPVKTTTLELSMTPEQRPVLITRPEEERLRVSLMGLIRLMLPQGQRLNVALEDRSPMPSAVPAKPEEAALIQGMDTLILRILGEAGREALELDVKFHRKGMPRHAADGFSWCLPKSQWQGYLRFGQEESALLFLVWMGDRLEFTEEPKGRKANEYILETGFLRVHKDPTGEWPAMNDASLADFWQWASSTPTPTGFRMLEAVEMNSDSTETPYDLVLNAEGSIAENPPKGMQGIRPISNVWQKFSTVMPNTELLSAPRVTTIAGTTKRGAPPALPEVQHRSKRISFSLGEQPTQGRGPGAFSTEDMLFLLPPTYFKRWKTSTGKLAVIADMTHLQGAERTDLPFDTGIMLAFLLEEVDENGPLRIAQGTYGRLSDYQWKRRGFLRRWKRIPGDYKVFQTHHEIEAHPGQAWVSVHRFPESGDLYLTFTRLEKAKAGAGFRYASPE